MATTTANKKFKMSSFGCVVAPLEALFYCYERDTKDEHERSNV